MKNSVLWQLYYNGHRSFLLGTIHLGTAFAFRKIELYKQLIHQCDAYAGESNLDDLSAKMIPGQFSPDYHKLYQSHLSTNQYAHLDRLIKKELPPLSDNWFYLHPLLLIGQLEQAFIGTDMPLTLDMALWEYAKSQQKELLAIESADRQHEIFEEIDLESGFHAIQKFISNLPATRKIYQKLAQNYAEENTQQLYLHAKKRLGKLRKKMLYDRNVDMAQSIIPLISNKPTFIGIGIGHLPGEKGVLRLLKKEGVKVEPAFDFVR